MLRRIRSDSNHSGWIRTIPTECEPFQPDPNISDQIRFFRPDPTSAAGYVLTEFKTFVRLGRFNPLMTTRLQIYVFSFSLAALLVFFR